MNSNTFFTKLEINKVKASLTVLMQVFCFRKIKLKGETICRSYEKFCLENRNEILLKNVK